MVEVLDAWTDRLTADVARRLDEKGFESTGHRAREIARLDFQFNDETQPPQQVGILTDDGQQLMEIDATIFGERTGTAAIKSETGGGSPS